MQLWDVDDKWHIEKESIIILKFFRQIALFQNSILIQYNTYLTNKWKSFPECKLQISKNGVSFSDFSHTCKVLDSSCAEIGNDDHVRKWRWLPPPSTGQLLKCARLPKMSEKNRAAILEMMKTPENNTCADCGAPSKSFQLMWLSWPNGRKHWFVFCWEF